MKPHKAGRFCAASLCFGLRNNVGRDSLTAEVALDLHYPPPPPTRRTSDVLTAKVHGICLMLSPPPLPPPFPPHHRMGTHKNIIGVESLSDVAGAEGLVMEIAVCDMFKACTGRSVPLFSLAQQIR